jgi:hypothetical protein
MTTVQEIIAIEAEIIKIENDPSQVNGGLRAWNSGRKTQLKLSAQRKIDKLNKRLESLYDLCEA